MASVSSPLSSESEGELFEVQDILGRRTRNGKVEYLVRWKGFDYREDSWEPVKNLRGCQSLIKKFSKSRSPSPGRRGRTPKRTQATQQVQSKQEVDEAEEFTKLKTPKTTQSSDDDFVILRRRNAPLSYKNKSKEEKEEVVITTKIETVEEKQVEHKEAVVEEVHVPSKVLPVTEASSKTTSARKEVLKIFAAVAVFAFVSLLLLSFVRSVGNGKN